MSSENAEGRFVTAPGNFPTANVPVWVTMHPDCDADALAVAQFILAYRNSTDDRLPYVKRSTIMKRFGKKKDWLDRRTKTLERIGFLTRVAVYTDAETGGRSYEPHSANGVVNNQAANDWMLHDTPPDGDSHPHPIQSSEFDRPDRVQKRINERKTLAAKANNRGGAAQRPGSEQRKHEFSQVNPQALHSAPPRRYTAPLRTRTR